MKVLVTGGRAYVDWKRVYLTLDKIHDHRRITLLIHGEAVSGVDKFADSWAEARGVDRVKFPANWTGRKGHAGPFRNGLMLREITPDLVVAFPGGTGTTDMKDRATAEKIKVVTISR